MNDAPTQFDPHAEELFVDPPGWPKLVGILSIVFGGISVFCGGVQMALTPLNTAMIEPALNGAPTPPGYGFDPFALSLQGVSLLLNVLLIIAGIMLVNRKAPAKIAHLVYAVLFVPLVVFTGIHGAKVMEAQQQWAKDYPDNDFARGLTQAGEMTQTIGIAVLFTILLISLAWPLFCLIWFGLVKTKHHHMTGEAAPDDPFAPAT